MYIAETKDELEEHSSSEHADGDGQRTEEQCPLCPSKSVQLRTHLAEVYFHLCIAWDHFVYRFDSLIHRLCCHNDACTCGNENNCVTKERFSYN